MVKEVLSTESLTNLRVLFTTKPMRHVLWLKKRSFNLESGVIFGKVNAIAGLVARPQDQTAKLLHNDGLYLILSFLI